MTGFIESVRVLVSQSIPEVVLQSESILVSELDVIIFLSSTAQGNKEIYLLLNLVFEFTHTHTH